MEQTLLIKEEPLDDMGQERDPLGYGYEAKLADIPNEVKEECLETSYSYYIEMVKVGPKFGQLNAQTDDDTVCKLGQVKVEQLKNQIDDDNHQVSMSDVEDVDIKVNDLVDLKIKSNLFQSKEPERINKTLGKVFTCNICNFITEYHDVFINHKNTHHNSSVLKSINFSKKGKKKSCTFCNYQAISLKDLQIHIVNHTDGKPYYLCNLCTYKTSDKCRLKVHIKNKHTVSIEKPFSCKLCEYKTFLKKYLKLHMKKHTNDKRNYCNFCKYKTNYKKLLIVHMKKHNFNGNQYTCKFCEFSTSDARYLRGHLRIHSTGKSFSCNLCTFSTSDARYLKVHLRIHIEKTILCNLCEYRAYTPYLLKVHMRKHTGEKPYTCHLCEHKVCSNRALKKHMRNHIEVET